MARFLSPLPNPRTVVLLLGSVLLLCAADVQAQNEMLPPEAGAVAEPAPRSVLLTASYAPDAVLPPRWTGRTGSKDRALRASRDGKASAGFAGMSRRTTLYVVGGALAAGLLTTAAVLLAGGGDDGGGGEESALADPPGRPN